MYLTRLDWIPHSSSWMTSVFSSSPLEKPFPNLFSSSYVELEKFTKMSSWERLKFAESFAVLFHNDVFYWTEENRSQISLITIISIWNSLLLLLWLLLTLWAPIICSPIKSSIGWKAIETMWNVPYKNWLLNMSVLKWIK